MATRSSEAKGSPRLERFAVSDAERGLRLDVVVAARLDEASRARIKRWIDDGLVLVEGARARASRPCRAGERIDVTIPPARPAKPSPEPIPLDVTYEDEHLLVVDKPAGMVVHPSPGHPSGTLVHALLAHCRDLSGIGGVERPGIVHRLDAGTSGLIVVAKHDRAHRRLAEQFERREVEKRYLALVHGRSAERLFLDAPLGRDARTRTKISSRSPRAKPASTEVERLEILPLSSLVSVRIRTGRTHQIRVHLSEAGFPVVGDRDYGAPRRRRGLPPGEAAAFRALAAFPRPALHASEIALRHPDSGEPMRWGAPLPRDIEELLGELRRHRARCAS